MRFVIVSKYFPVRVSGWLRAAVCACLEENSVLGKAIRMRIIKKLNWESEIH